MFGVVDISMWASDRCLGIFQSHLGLWDISAWESGGFLGFWSWWVAQMCRTASDQILELLGGSNIGGQILGAARCLALLTKGHIGACQKQENQSWWAAQTCRKYKGPDPLASWGGNQIIAASRCFGAVAISMWASDRCLGIFQSHSGLWNISAWESGGFLGFWSWWVAQMSLVAHGFPGSWQICRQLFRCSVGVFPCCCVHRMLAIICH